MRENPPRIRICLDQLSEDQIWQKPNPSSNSIANLIIHLNGNITQYIVSALGGAPDERKRDEEFSRSAGLSKEKLQKTLEGTIEKSCEIIRNLDEDSLMRRRVVQGFDLTGIGIIIHVVEHLSYHTGQIAFWTKALNDKDLGFYQGLDLNQKNE